MSYLPVNLVQVGLVFDNARPHPVKSKSWGSISEEKNSSSNSKDVRKLKTTEKASRWDSSPKLLNTKNSTESENGSRWESLPALGGKMMPLVQACRWDSLPIAKEMGGPRRPRRRTEVPQMGPTQRSGDRAPRSRRHSIDNAPKCPSRIFTQEFSETTMDALSSTLTSSLRFVASADTSPPKLRHRSVSDIPDAEDEGCLNVPKKDDMDESSWFSRLDCIEDSLHSAITMDTLEAMAELSDLSVSSSQSRKQNTLDILNSVLGESTSDMF